MGRQAALARRWRIYCDEVAGIINDIKSPSPLLHAFQIHLIGSKWDGLDYEHEVENGTSIRTWRRWTKTVCIKRKWGTSDGVVIELELRRFGWTRVRYVEHENGTSKLFKGRREVMNGKVAYTEISRFMQ